MDAGIDKEFIKSDDLPFLIPFFDLLSKTPINSANTEQIVVKSDNNTLKDNSIFQTNGVGNSSFSNDFYNHKIIVSFKKNILTLSANNIIHAIDLVDNTPETSERQNDNSNNLVEIDRAKQFVDECNNKIRQLREQLNQKKGKNIILIGSPILKLLPENFIKQVEDYINNNLPKVHASNLFFFYAKEQRFLKIEGSSLPSRFSRFRQIFIKKQRNRMRYQYQIKNFNQKIALYLLFLSKMLEQKAESASNFFKILNMEHEGGSIRFLDELYHSYLVSLSHREIDASQKVDAEPIPSIDVLSGYQINKTKDPPSNPALKDNGKNSIPPSLKLLTDISKEKPENIPVILKSADKVSLPKTDIDEEKILKIWPGSLKLKNFKYRSNISMRGKFILTNKRLIAYRKKLGFFPNIPLIGYVRPNNRMTIIMLRIIDFLSQFRHLLTSLIRAIGFPVIFGLFVGLQSLKAFINRLPFDFPSLEISAITKLISFITEHPDITVAIGGSLGGISYLSIKLFRFLFHRSRAIVVLPLPMLTGIQSHPKQSTIPHIICKPKGSDILPGLKQGLSLKLNIQAHSLPNIPGTISKQSIILTLAAISSGPT